MGGSRRRTRAMSVNAIRSTRANTAMAATVATSNAPHLRRRGGAQRETPSVLLGRAVGAVHLLSRATATRRVSAPFVRWAGKVLVFVGGLAILLGLAIGHGFLLAAVASLSTGAFVGFGTWCSARSFVEPRRSWPSGPGSVQGRGCAELTGAPLPLVVRALPCDSPIPTAARRAHDVAPQSIWLPCETPRIIRLFAPTPTEQTARK